MRITRLMGVFVISLCLVGFLFSPVTNAADDRLPSIYPAGIDPTKLSPDEARRLAEEVRNLFGPKVEFASFSLGARSAQEPGKVLETEEETIEMTLDEARSKRDWNILMPDRWPEFIPEGDLQNATVTLTKTMYVESDREPRYSSDLIVPGHIQIRQFFTDGIFATPGGLRDPQDRPVRVMATIIDGRPALLYRIAGSGVEITWATEEFVVYLSAMRDDISELEMLRFANSLN